MLHIPVLEEYLAKRSRKFVSYSEGAKLYCIPYYSFVRLAKEAKANYTMRKNVIVDVELIERYLEQHPSIVERLEKVRELG